MKKWENADLEELRITETKQGGTPSMIFDNYFYDEDGALHVNFANDSGPTPPPPGLVS